MGLEDDPYLLWPGRPSFRGESVTLPPIIMEVKKNVFSKSSYPFKISSQMLHVGNIYLHFPLNVAIFDLM